MFNITEEDVIRDLTTLLGNATVEDVGLLNKIVELITARIQEFEGEQEVGEVDCEERDTKTEEASCEESN